jgi:hypothetical protein
MLKFYLMVIVLGILASVGFGAYWYYNDTQQRITVLRENNAKLQVAIETSEASLDILKRDIAKFQELNSQLQQNLQQAEEYGDELRDKLRRHDLTELAIRKPTLLEGKMNGATAKLWRDLEKDTGGTGDDPLPHWLQSPSVEQQTGTASPSSDESGKDDSTSGTETQTDKSG